LCLFYEILLEVFFLEVVELLCEVLGHHDLVQVLHALLGLVRDQYVDQLLQHVDHSRVLFGVVKFAQNHVRILFLDVLTVILMRAELFKDISNLKNVSIP
jgi:hypothetical protein